MNELQVFNYGSQEVRTILVENEPWWVLVDVCRVLDLTTPSKVAQRLDDDEKMTLNQSQCHSGRRGGAQRIIVINESGLYSVILRSDKDEAKAFKRWITHEVLPAIRQTGKYITPVEETKIQPSVETGLQRAGLIIRAAEHKAVPQHEQLRLLDIAIRDLTGTGIDFSPAPPPTSLNLMDLPEVYGVLKKGKSKRAGKSKVDFLPITDIADRIGMSVVEFNNYADRHGIKNAGNGEWVRVNSPSGEAREFLYADWVVKEYREGVYEND